MKILITGLNSYVGNSVEQYILNKNKNFSIKQLEMKNDKWKNHKFSSYDVIFHVAGLAHKKIKKNTEHLYFEINRDMAIAVAEKAKIEGVRQFIFMSTMSVYSYNFTYITKDTPTLPDNVYGLSKLQAEEKIWKLNDSDNFIVSIIRAPMIYGRGCKGNYNTLKKFSMIFPVFPKINNKKSMLYIDNLSELIYQLINNKASGIYYPQNKELVNTSEWVKMIAKENKRNIYLSSFLGWCVKVGKNIPGINTYCIKAFSDSYYDPLISKYNNLDYQIITFLESIKLTEKKDD